MGRRLELVHQPVPRVFGESHVGAKQELKQLQLGEGQGEHVQGIQRIKLTLQNRDSSCCTTAKRQYFI